MKNGFKKIITLLLVLSLFMTMTPPTSAFTMPERPPAAPVVPSMAPPDNDQIVAASFDPEWLPQADVYADDAAQNSLGGYNEVTSSGQETEPDQNIQTGQDTPYDGIASSEPPEQTTPPGEQQEEFTEPDTDEDIGIEPNPDFDLSDPEDETEEQETLMALEIEPMEVTGVLTYTVNGFNVTITGCNTTATSEQIAGDILAIQGEGYSIVTIANNAFQNCASLTEITIPDSVTTVGSYAFSGCTNLLKATIGKGITSIGTYAFSYTPRLSEMIFAGGAAPTIQSYAITNVTIAYVPQGTASGYEGKNFGGITEYTAGNKTGIDWDFDELTGKLTISGYGRMGNYSDRQYVPWSEYLSSIVNVEIGEGVQSIAQNAFYGSTNLSSVVIPSTVDAVGANAFYNCSKLTEVMLPVAVKSIGASAFSGCSNLPGIIVPAAVTSIGAYAFRECGKLAYATISNGLLTIEGYAFQNCTSLSEITIPDSVTAVGSYAFSGCTNLLKATIGKGITSIGTYAFSYTPRLSEMIFTSGAAPTIQSYAITNVTIAYVPQGTASGYEGKNFGGITEYTVGNKTGIDWDFDELTGKLTISGYGRMGNYSDMQYVPWSPYISSIVSIEIGEGVQSIAQNAFYGSTNLISVVIPSTVDAVGANAFYNCSKLTEVILPVAVKSIGANAFSGCSDLLGITVPAAVISIGNYAFSGCSNLENVTFELGYTFIDGQYAFRNAPKVRFITPKNSLSTIYAIDYGIPFEISNNNGYQFPATLLNREMSAFLVDYSALSVTGTIQLKANYRVTSLAGVSNSRVIMKLSPNLTLSNKNPVMLNDAICNDYTYNASTGTLTVPVVVAKNNIDVAVVPADTTALYAYASFECSLSGSSVRDIIGVVCETNPAVMTISATGEINSPTFKVKGIAPADANVDIFVEGTKVGTTKATKNGTYSLTVSIPDPVDGTAYTISAETSYGDGKLTASMLTVYDVKAPSVLEFIMYLDSRVFDLSELSGTKPSIQFTASQNPWVFTVKMLNSQMVDRLFVCSTKNGEKLQIEAKWDPGKELWVASGHFDTVNKLYVPGTLTVEYTRKSELPIIDEEPDFTDPKYTDVLSDKFKEIIADDSKVHVETQDFGTDGKKITSTIDIDDLGAQLVVVNSKETLPGNMTVSSAISQGYTRVVDGNNRELYVKSTIQYADDMETATGQVTSIIDFVRDTYIDQTVEIAVKGGLAPENVGGIAGVAGFLLNGTKQGTQYYNDNMRLDAAQRFVNNSGMSQTQKAYYNQRILSARIANHTTALCTAAGFMLSFTTLVLGVSLVPFGIGIGIAALGLFAGLIRDAILSDFDHLQRESDGYGVGINWHIDPSGYVYEAVTANRLDNVKATAWWIEPGEDTARIWDSTEYEQDNPLYTDYNGRYAWDTPEGLWQVHFEKSGYEPAQSEWLPVPPPQLEVNVGMVSLAAPEIAWFSVYSDYAEVEFTKYLKPDTVNGLVLKAPSGATISYSLEYPQAEHSLDGIVFAKKYELIYNGGFIPAQGNYTLTTVSSILSYADVPVKQETRTAELTLPISLAVPDNVAIEYGTVKDIVVSVMNYNPSKPLTFTAESDFGFIAEVKNVSEISSDGKVTVSVSGNLPGNANIILIIAEKGVEVLLPVYVSMPGDQSRIIISPREVNVPKSGTQQFTATDEFTSDTATVAWSLTGNQSAGTTINTTGLLSVAADETAATLTITAVALDGSERFNTAIVHIAPVSSFLLGDVSRDGRIDMQDVLLIYQYFRSKVTLTGDALLAADVNGDSVVNMVDVLSVYQYFRGKISSFEH